MLVPRVFLSMSFFSVLNLLIVSRSHSFFFFFWLCWIFVTLHRLSLDAASEGYSSCNALHCIAVSILVAEHARALGVRTTVVVARVLSNYRPRFAAP